MLPTCADRAVIAGLSSVPSGLIHGSETEPTMPDLWWSARIRWCILAGIACLAPFRLAHAPDCQLCSFTSLSRSQSGRLLVARYFFLPSEQWNKPHWSALIGYITSAACRARAWRLHVQEVHVARWRQRRHSPASRTFLSLSPKSTKTRLKTSWLSTGF